MKKTMIAVAFAASLASVAPATAQSIDADPFAADQSLVLLAGLGTAGTIAAVVAAIVVVGVIAEATQEDEPAAAVGSTSSSTSSTTSTN